MVQLTYYFKPDVFINNEFSDWLKVFKTAKFVEYAVNNKHHPKISIRKKEFYSKKTN